MSPFKNKKVEKNDVYLNVFGLIQSFNSNKLLIGLFLGNQTLEVFFVVRNSSVNIEFLQSRNLSIGN